MSDSESSPAPGPGDLVADSRRIWDTNAEAWDTKMAGGGGFQNALMAPTIEAMLDIRPGERVLDIACGNGIFARRLADLGATVVASDFSPRLIELAQARSADYADRISYAVADATDEAQLLALAGPDARLFDAAICANALMDMPAVAPLFRAVARLLKPGGRFVFSIMHPCFNGQAIAMQAELPDYADGPVYSIKVAQYLSAQTTKGLAITEQPLQQYYWHRPLHLLLNPAFEAGLVLDRLEEPPFRPDPPPASAFSWANYDMPPLLFARLRPAAR
jgi:2-polyprenyl-3-methyl-5-hydroxy-6-metoxy-1,4-benzoquinol methylase